MCIALNINIIFTFTTRSCCYNLTLILTSSLMSSIKCANTQYFSSAVCVMRNNVHFNDCTVLNYKLIKMYTCMSNMQHHDCLFLALFTLAIRSFAPAWSAMASSSLSSTQLASTFELKQYLILSQVLLSHFTCTFSNFKCISSKPNLFMIESLGFLQTCVFQKVSELYVCYLLLLISF